MSNPSELNPRDRQSFKREVYTDADGNVQTREIRHRNDSVNSQLIEEKHLFANRRIRDNGVMPSLLVGIMLAALLGIGGVVWYLLSQSNQEPVQPVIIPGNATPRSTPQAPPSLPDVKIEVPSSPIPQPSPAPSSLPDVKIMVPSVPAPQAPSSGSQADNDTKAPSPPSETTTDTEPTSPSSDSTTTNSTDNSTSSENPTSPNNSTSSEQGQQ